MIKKIISRFAIGNTSYKPVDCDLKKVFRNVVVAIKLRICIHLTSDAFCSINSGHLSNDCAIERTRLCVTREQGKKSNRYRIYM